MKIEYIYRLYKILFFPIAHIVLFLKMASAQENLARVVKFCALAKQNKETDESKEKVNIQGLMKFLVDNLEHHYELDYLPCELDFKPYCGDNSHGVLASQFSELCAELQTHFPRCKFKFGLYTCTVWQGSGQKVKELFNGDIEAMRLLELKYNNDQKFLYIRSVTVILP